MTFPESSMANYPKRGKKNQQSDFNYYVTQTQGKDSEKKKKKELQTQDEVFTDVTLLGFPLYLTG